MIKEKKKELIELTIKEKLLELQKSCLNCKKMVQWGKSWKMTKKLFVCGDNIVWSKGYMLFESIK